MAISSAIAVSDFSPLSSAMFCSFFPGGGDTMMSMPLSARLVSSVRRISPWPPPNQRFENAAKFSFTASKASWKRRRDSTSRSWIAFSVSRIESSRSWRCVFEIVALLCFLEFFEGLRIHRTQGFDLRPDLAAFLLGLGHTGFVELRFLRLPRFLRLRRSSPCGWSRPDTAVRPAGEPAPAR